VHRKHHIAWLVGGLIAIAATRLFHDAYSISIVNLVFIACLFAASFRFVMLIGEMSFASAAFVGIGAYGAGVATTMLHWPFAAAMLVGPVVATLVSIAFGLIVLRIKGPYFMLIGFAFAEAVQIGLSQIQAIGGPSGMVGIFPPQLLDQWMQSFVATAVVAALYLLHRLERSDFGKLLGAIRDNDNVVRTVGVNVLSAKVACFAIASFMAGLVGGLTAFVNNVIAPSDFSFMLANFALVYVKVGGERSLFGAIAGAVVMVLLSSYSIVLGASNELFYGAAIVVTILLMPQGLAGLIEKSRLRLPALRAARMGS
jgi:branched-chain amino acid transport system permease protein